MHALRIKAQIDRFDRMQYAIFAQKALDGRLINARIVSEASDALFLSVVRLEDPRPLRPRVACGAFLGQRRHHLQLCHARAAQPDA